MGKSMSEKSDKIDHGAMTLRGGRSSKNIFIIDLEYTGLNFTQDTILEIAVIVTDPALTVLGTYEAVIHHDEQCLQNMSDWCRKEFSGTLIERVRESRKTMAVVERELGEFFDLYRDNKKVILAGSSVSTDRMFLQYCMPDMVRDRLHYRIIDISSIMELAKRWCPPVYHGAPNKPTAHRALLDAQASLHLLKHYRDSGFVGLGDAAKQKGADAVTHPWRAGQLFTAAHAGHSPPPRAHMRT